MLNNVSNRVRSFWRTKRRQVLSAIGAFIVFGAFLFKQYEFDPTVEIKERLKRAGEVHDIEQMLYAVSKRQIGYGTLEMVKLGIPPEEQKKAFVDSTNNMSDLTVSQLGVSSVMTSAMPNVDQTLQDTKKQLVKDVESEKHDLGEYENGTKSLDAEGEKQFVVNVRKRSIDLRERAEALNIQVLRYSKMESRIAEQRTRSFGKWEVFLFVLGWFVAFVSKLFLSEDTSLENLPEV